MRLDRDARDELAWAGISAREWARHYPHHDRCGCHDDRCAGFHHDEAGPCGCLPVLIAAYRPFGRPRGAGRVPCPTCGAPGAAGACG